MESSSCIVCGAADPDPTERIGPYQLARCRSCGLEFTANPEHRIADYELAYTGDAGILPDVTPYTSPATRLALEARALWLPPPYLTAAERLVLRRLRATLPRDAKVLDIGCGTGRFLRAARRAGFEVLGIEPSATIVRHLRTLGLDVREGALPGLGVHDPTVRAVTLFEVLEHLPDPLPALAEIRSAFPSALLAVSVPSPLRHGLERGLRGPSDYPPNHYTRWTPESLRVALQAAGFERVEVLLPRPSGREFMPPLGALAVRLVRTLRGGAPPATARAAGQAQDQTRLVRRVGATAALTAHWAAGLALSALGAVQAWRAARRGRSSASMVGLAFPHRIPADQ